MAVFTNIGSQPDPIKKKFDLSKLGIKGLKEVPNFASAKDGIINPSTTGNMSLDFSGKSGFSGSGLANAGIDVATMIPEVASQLQINPADGQSANEVRDLQKAKSFGIASSGAKIGGTIGTLVGGPVGGLIGGFLGAGAGYAFSDSKKEKALAEFRKRENEKSQKEFDAQREANLQSYLNLNSSERIKKEMDLIAQSQGLIV